VASDRESGSVGVFTQATLLSMLLSVLLSVPLKWASTSANPAVQCHCEPTLHALVFQVAHAR